MIVTGSNIGNIPFISLVYPGSEAWHFKEVSKSFYWSLQNDTLLRSSIHAQQILGKTIVSVDHIETSSMSDADVAKLVVGPVGSIVKLSVVPGRYKYGGLPPHTPRSCVQMVRKGVDCRYSPQIMASSKRRIRLPSVAAPRLSDFENPDDCPKLTPNHDCDAGIDNDADTVSRALMAMHAMAEVQSVTAASSKPTGSHLPIQSIGCRGGAAAQAVANSRPSLRFLSGPLIPGP